MHVWWIMCISNKSYTWIICMVQNSWRWETNMIITYYAHNTTIFKLKKVCVIQWIPPKQHIWCTQNMLWPATKRQTNGWLARCSVVNPRPQYPAKPSFRCSFSDLPGSLEHVPGCITSLKDWVEVCLDSLLAYCGPYTSNHIFVILNRQFHKEWHWGYDSYGQKMLLLYYPW